jgi:predicted CXXCH cytochrome family protein
MRPSARLAAALAVLAVIGIADQSMAQVKSGVFGSLHDVDGHGCKSCHVSHNGSVAVPPGTDQSTGELLLWDRALSNVTFGAYDSPTMNRKPVEVGGLPLLRTESRMYTLLCLSCHDGVTTPAVVMATSAKVGSLSESDGLRNDHPVNVSWNHQTRAGGLPPCSNCHIFHGRGQRALPFYGGTIQCSSCHDPHTRVNEKFLRITNTNSALCIFCHG